LIPATIYDNQKAATQPNYVWLFILGRSAADSRDEQASPHSVKKFF